MKLRQPARAAEDAAARFLEAQGYQIVQRNVATPYGELDIVALDEGMVVFVEVKSRATDEWGPPQAGVNRRKQRALRRVAEIFLTRHKLLDTPCRFDVVALTRTPEGEDWRIELFQDAF